MASLPLYGEVCLAVNQKLEEEKVTKHVGETGSIWQ